MSRIYWGCIDPSLFCWSEFPFVEQFYNLRDQSFWCDFSSFKVKVFYPYSGKKQVNLYFLCLCRFTCELLFLTFVAVEHLHHTAPHGHPNIDTTSLYFYFITADWCEKQFFCTLMLLSISCILLLVHKWIYKWNVPFGFGI